MAHMMSSFFIWEAKRDHYPLQDVSIPIRKIWNTARLLKLLSQRCCAQWDVLVSKAGEDLSWSLNGQVVKDKYSIHCMLTCFYKKRKSRVDSVAITVESGGVRKTGLYSCGSLLHEPNWLPSLNYSHNETTNKSLWFLYGRVYYYCFSLSFETSFSLSFDNRHCLLYNEF